MHRVLHSLEQVHAQLLEARACDGAVEVDALVQRVQLHGGLRSAGQRALCALAGGAQTTQGARVVADVLLVLALELLLKRKSEAAADTTEVSGMGESMG
jgi:hypothetical protein